MKHCYIAPEGPCVDLKHGFSVSCVFAYDVLCAGLKHGYSVSCVCLEPANDMLCAGLKHGYNVPEVLQCPYLPDWLLPERRHQITDIVDDRELPEQMRRILCDGYICMYRNPTLETYR